ncbi:MAG TPA: hypothetical protein VMF09_07020 [Solirubrobacteraceae bacterium]|nr:hypothetical protein [Solirubrobacteraceae bacterium]
MASGASVGRSRNLVLAAVGRSVLYVMAAIMAAGAIVAFLGLRPGVQEAQAVEPHAPPGARGPEPEPSRAG